MWTEEALIKRLKVLIGLFPADRVTSDFSVCQVKRAPGGLSVKMVSRVQKGRRVMLG